MSSRYEDRIVYENAQDAYDEQLSKRGVKKINHYGTPVLGTPSELDYEKITLITHTWSVGDRFYKLSHKHYGSTKYWWVIAQYNGTPTESHVKLGQKVKIPIPLEEIIDILKGES